MRAIVTFQRVGFHRWDGATERRAYLGQRHRHLFMFRVEIDVHHGDREIEFHDLRDHIIDACGLSSEPVEFGPMSCEQIASLVIYEIRKKYGPGRAGAVEVWEDGEVGARVEFYAET